MCFCGLWWWLEFWFRVWVGDKVWLRSGGLGFWCWVVVVWVADEVGVIRLDKTPRHTRTIILALVSGLVFDFLDGF